MSPWTKQGEREVPWRNGMGKHRSPCFSVKDFLTVKNLLWHPRQATVTVAQRDKAWRTVVQQLPVVPWNISKLCYGAPHYGTYYSSSYGNRGLPRLPWAAVAHFWELKYQSRPPRRCYVWPSRCASVPHVLPVSSTVTKFAGYNHNRSPDGTFIKHFPINFDLTCCTKGLLA